MSDLVVIGCGTRRMVNVSARLLRTVDDMLSEVAPRFLIEGGATGADRVWANVAKKRGIQVIECPVSNAQWRREGRRAGPKRNRLMATLAAQLARLWPLTVECWALPGGPGTESMKRIARGYGWHVREVSES